MTVLAFKRKQLAGERDGFADELRARLDTIRAASADPGFADSDVGRYAVVMLRVLRRAAAVVAETLKELHP